MRKKFKHRLILVLVVACFAAAIIYRSSSGTLLEKGVADFEASISSAAYDALGSELISRTDFSDYFKIVCDDSGAVALITSDSASINLLSHSLAVRTLNFYKEYCQKGVEIPVGAFTGVRMLSGVGKKVRIKMLSVQSVRCDFVSAFEEAGINQTRQSLFLNVVADVYVIYGGRRISKSGSVSVLVYDNIIVGKVPQTYLNAQIVGSGGATGK